MEPGVGCMAYANGTILLIPDSYFLFSLIYCYIPGKYPKYKFVFYVN